MNNREKVIKGLECCSAMSGEKCRECPYSSECLDENFPVGMSHLAADALWLLKIDGCENCAMAVEDRQMVVRCKDCKYYAVEDHYGNFHGYEILAASDVPTCHRWGNDTVMVKPNGDTVSQEKGGN